MLRARVVMPFIFGCLMALPSAAYAQTGGNEAAESRTDLRLIGGYSGFIDEEMIHHAVLGAGVRFGLTARVAAEGEVIYMLGPGRDTDWLFMPAVSFDLRRGGAVVPYLVFGAGWLRTTIPVGTGAFSSTSWTAGGGGGVRVNVARDWYVGVDGRLGSEPVTRCTVALGWRLPPTGR